MVKLLNDVHNSTNLFKLSSFLRQIDYIFIQQIKSFSLIAHSNYSHKNAAR